MPYDQTSVHFVKKGKMGYVSHSLLENQTNCWVRNWNEMATWGGAPKYNDAYLVPGHHIPHGSPVLITEEPQILDIAGNYYYRVFWGDIDCWIVEHFIINPYHQKSSIFLV